MTLKESVVVKKKVASVPARYQVVQPLLRKHWCFLDIDSIKAKEDTGLKGICVIYGYTQSTAKGFSVTGLTISQEKLKNSDIFLFVHIWFY